MSSSPRGLLLACYNPQVHYPTWPHSPQHQRRVIVANGIWYKHQGGKTKSALTRTYSNSAIKPDHHPQQQ
jgi:hypothetical protein